MMTQTPQPLEQEDLIGQVIRDRYRILELIGEGGMGAIYLAEHLTLHKRVALKVVRPKHAGNEAAAARFAREAMVTATIDHPNVISAIDYGELEDGGAFFAMQLVEGGTLTQLLEREHQLHWSRAANLGAQIADAVLAAGKHGIVHRDLKPDNLLIQETADGEELVKVLDFGIAKFARDSLAPPSARKAQQVTQVGIVVGTPGYMSPEQALGEATDHRSDLYALGVILWEAVVGERLWQGDGIRQIIRKQLNDTAPPVRVASGDPSIPEALENLIAMLTLRDADQRPSDLQRVRDILREVAESGRISRDFDPPTARALSERVRELAPHQPTLQGLSASQVSDSQVSDSQVSVGGPVAVDLSEVDPQAVPHEGHSEPSPGSPAMAPGEPTPPMRKDGAAWRKWIWVGLFAASLTGGVLLGRSDAPGGTDEGAAADGETRPTASQTSPPSRGNGTGLPKALDGALNALIQAEGRSERVAAAESLLGHIPVGEVPGYVRLLAHFQLAETCSDKAQVVQKLDELADPRSLPALVLASQRAKEGCGPHNRDCLACMRDELDATIIRLESKQVSRR